MTFAKICHTTIASAFALSLAAGTAAADTLLVPSEYGTIQSAIDAASPGDSILIADGTYSENLSIVGKTNLWLRGSGATYLDSLYIQDSPAIGIENVRFEGASSPGIVALRVDDMQVNAAIFKDNTGVEITQADNVIIDRCRFARSRLDIAASEVITIARSLMSASDLDISNCENMLVTANRLKRSSIFSMNTTGSRWQLNAFRKSRTTIINGFGTEIAQNVFRGTAADDGYALWTRLFDNGLVEENVFKRSGPVGALRIEGDDSTFRNNRSRRSAGYGMHVTGTADDNLIENNNFRRSADFDLFDQAGAGENTYIGNNFQTSNL